MSRRIHRHLASLALALLGASAASGSGEKWVIGNRTYEDVRIASSNAGSVTIFHRGGIVQLDLESLPTDMQVRFGFNPEQSALWKQQAEAELAATAAPRRSKSLLNNGLEDKKTGRAPPGSTAIPKTQPGPIEVQLRVEVDLRPHYSHHGLYFKSQGRRPSCAIFAAVSAIEYELARRVGLPGPLSEEFVIWATRELQPGIPIDDGYHFQELLAAVQTFGIPTQKSMPNSFGVPLDEIRPTQEALLEANLRRFVVPVWYRPSDPDILARVVHALHNETSVVVGIRWPHWRTLQNNNLLRDQRPLADAGHAVTLIGYRCPEGNLDNLVFLFRNSYGVDWGMGGCAFVAAAYLKENLLAAFHISVPDQVATSGPSRTGN